jgi:hypothetical protein
MSIGTALWNIAMVGSVEWQWKSHAFMEIVTLKELSVESGQQKIKDFDLFCK